MSAGSSSLIPRRSVSAGEAGACVEVRHLGQRVYAGVGAPRSVQPEVSAPGDSADRAGDLALDRLRIFLNLPAAVTRAGVLNRQLEARQIRPPL